MSLAAVTLTAVTLADVSLAAATLAAVTLAAATLAAVTPAAVTRCSNRPGRLRSILFDTRVGLYLKNDTFSPGWCQIPVPTDVSTQNRCVSRGF